MQEDFIYTPEPADTTCPWFPVDNASNLYAGARRRNWCRTYRTALILDEEINPEIMQKALTDTAIRFPSMTGRLKDGLFWSYFEYAGETPLLQKERYYPYMPISLTGNRQPNFRVLYYKNRLSLEAYHAVSDGGGSNAFLIALAARYYELKGEKEAGADFYRNDSAVPLKGETEDSYLRVAEPDKAKKTENHTGIFLSDQHPEKNFHRLIHGIMPLTDVKAAAEKYKLTVTEYLTAGLILMFIQGSPAPIDKTVSISIPIDLRKRFSSVTMRNFCYMADVEFNPMGRRDVSFEEICDAIRGKLKEKTTREALLGAVSANVSAQKSPVLRSIPYPIKRISLKNSYKKNQHSFTTFLTNGGNLNCSDALKRHILRAELCLGDTPFMHFGCGVVTVNGIMNFTFCMSNHDTVLPKIFFRFLASQGIPVRIESNIYE